MNIIKYNTDQLYHIYGNNIKQLNTIQSNSITEEQFMQLYKSVKPYIAQKTNQNSFQQIFDIVTVQTMGNVKGSQNITHRQQLNNIYYYNHKIDKLKQHITYMKSINQNIKGAYNVNSSSIVQLSNTIKQYTVDKYNKLSQKFSELNYNLFYLYNKQVLANLNGYYNGNIINGDYFKVKNTQDNFDNEGITIYTYPQNKMKIVYNYVSNQSVEIGWTPKNNNFIKLFSMFNGNMTTFSKVYVSVNISQYSGHVPIPFNAMTAKLNYGNGNSFPIHNTIYSEEDGSKVTWVFNNVPSNYYWLSFTINRGQLQAYSIILTDLQIRYSTYEQCTTDNYSNNYLSIENITTGSTDQNLQQLLP